MNIKLLSTSAEAQSAASLAEINHASLRSLNPFLPKKTAFDFQPRIEWMMREGQVYGAFDDKQLTAFMGTFTIDNFRNEGPGSFTPDWCLYIDQSPEGRKTLPELYKTIINGVLREGINKHAIGVYAHRLDIKEFFELCAYGRIVMDAAAPSTLLSEVFKTNFVYNKTVEIKRALGSDASILSDLDARLAAHIGAIPILMPQTHGSTAEEWEEWLNQDDTVAFLAFKNGEPLGFIKAQDPQFDVTFSVHDSRTFAINGLFVLPEFRGRHIAQGLLHAVVKEAGARGKTLISVDCETMNPEAYSFWTRYFSPISWSMLRRF